MNMARTAGSPKRTIKFNWRAVLFGFAIGFFFGTIIFFFYSQFFQISRVEVEGNKFVSTKDIRDTVRFGLVGRVYGVIPARHISFFPKDQIKITLADKYPRLDEIIFYRESLNLIKVSVTEKKPEALWCSDDGSCSFVDRDGFVYAPAPRFSPGVFLEWTSATGTDPWASRQPIEPEYFSKLLLVGDDLDEILHQTSAGRWQIVSVEKGDSDDWSFGVTDKTKPMSDWEIFINGKTDRGQINIAMRAVLEGMGAVGTTTGLLPLLDYVDLRFENKVFYRLAE